MFRPPRKPCCSVAGEGARVLTLLSMLPELGVRRRFSESMGGGEGGSIGAMDTRPAMRETLCCDDLRRGRGDDGERAKGCMEGVGGRHRGGGMSCIGEEVMGVGFRAGDLRLEKA